MKHILDFEELSAHDLSIGGGKAVNLAELIRAGMPVPDGFVISTSAYDQFVKDNQLEQLIDSSLNKSQASVIRQAFISGKIPADLKQSISDAYHRLDQPKVAVRSSGTAEDLPDAAFAGQYDTYLNIISEEQLYKAVKKSWASLWTDRVINYRQRLDMNHKENKLAIIVQTMIDADFSGVIFTANPMTANRDQIIIDANPGLGEAVVSGAVTPDHYILEKHWGFWTVIDYRPGKREVMVRSKKGGGTEEVKEKQESPELSKTVLKQLTQYGSRIDQHFGKPQDIEWAVADNTVYILQARPITALPDYLFDQNRFSRMIASLLAEIIPQRPYPLEASTLGPDMIVNQFLRPFLRKIGLKIPAVRNIFAEENGVLTHFRGIRFRSSLRLIYTPIWLIKEAALYDPANWRQDPLLVNFLDKMKELDKKDKEKLSDKKLIKVIDEVLERASVIFEIRIRYLPRVAFAVIGVFLFLLVAGKRKQLADLLYSGIETKVTETNEQLQKLASIIGSDKTLHNIFKKHESDQMIKKLKKTKGGQAFLQRFNQFLQEYGYRESAGTLSISQPTWKDHPEIVLGLLKSLLGASDQTSEQKDHDAQEQFEQIIAGSYLAYWPFRPIFSSVSETARYLHVIRENTRFYLMMTMPILRATIFEIAERLVKQSKIETMDDVFFLKFSELKQLLKKKKLNAKAREKWNTLIQKRKKTYARLAEKPLVDPRLYRISSKQEQALIAGTAGSPGMAKGKARIITSLEEFDKLQSGQILVAPYTNPAWTPLFEKAAAVVVDTGGIMSHAAIVAREYGIPAVMGTVDGTKRIEDGMEIEVDGSKGLVFEVE